MDAVTSRQIQDVPGLPLIWPSQIDPGMIQIILLVGHVGIVNMHSLNDVEMRERYLYDLSPTHKPECP